MNKSFLGMANMKTLFLTALAGWTIFIAHQAVAVPTTVSYPISHQRIVPLSRDCSIKESATIHVRPLLPTTNITANILKVDRADDYAVVSVSGGGSAIRSSGSPCFNANTNDVDIKAMLPSSKDGAFDIVLSDFTSTNFNNVNQIEFSGTQIVTFDVAAPLPPAISDTNADEQVCATRYNECTMQDEIVCWYESAGCSGCSSRGSPQVSLGLANFNVKVEDTPVWHDTAVGEPLALNMRYSNYGDTSPGQTFGPKWSCNWNSRVTVLNAATNRMVFPSGSIVLFTQSTANVYLPPSALEGALVKTNGIYRYTQPDGWSWEYAPSVASTNIYLLSAVRDVWSNTVGVAYTNGDRLYRVRQTAPDTGLYLEFRYSGTNGCAVSVVLKSATTNLEKSAAFSYSPESLLTNVVDMGGYSYSYVYEGGYLSQVNKGTTIRSSVFYSAPPNTWTATNSYWVQLTNAGGITRKYTWLFGLVREETTLAGGSATNVDFYSVSTAGSRGRVLTDAMGAGLRQQYQYNAQGRVTNRIDRTGAQWRQTYNAQNRLLTLVDPLSNATTYVYDANGVDLLYEIPPSGPVRRVFTYVPGKHAVATESNALGQIITYAYNSLGLVTNAHDGRVTNEYFYDVEGRLTAHYRSGELVETNQYDDVRRVYWTRDAAGLETVHTNDALNRLSTKFVISPERTSEEFYYYDCCFNTVSRDRCGNYWSYEYNDLGRKLSELNPLGLSTTYQYGLAEKPTSIVVSATGGDWRYDCRYDSEGRLAWLQHPARPYDGTHAENFWHDGEGRLTKRQTVTGAYYRYVYDAAGRLVSIEVPDGTTSAFAVENYVLAESNKYDALGRKWWTKDIRGLVTSNTFNALGQVLKTHYPDASTEEWTYNPWGQALTYKDRAGNTASNFYDARGRLWRQVDARQSGTYLAYANADLVSIVSNSSGQVWRYAYDAERRVREIIHPDPAVVETFAYSRMGSLTQRVCGGVADVMTYDALGKRTSVRVGGALVESNRYDQLGRLVWSQNAEGLAVSNAWDSWGELMNIQWPGNRNECYRYGDRGLTNIVDRLTNSLNRERDGLGRLTRWIDGEGDIGGNDFWSNGVDQVQFLWDGNGGQTSWDYDIYGNPTAKTIYDNITGDSNTNRFQYDKLGRATNKLDAAHVATRYAYDAGGNLLTLAPGADPAISFAYDGRGRPTNMVDGVGATAWAFDAMDRLRSEAGPFGTLVEADYDTLGRMTNLEFAGREWSYRYDALGRVTNLVAPEGVYRFAYLAQGGRTAGVQFPNGLAATNAYDNWTRVTNTGFRSGGTVIASFRHGYDVGDRRTNEVGSDGRNRAFAYDRAHRLTNVVSGGFAGDNAAYRYDKVGNAVERTESGLGSTNAFNKHNQITTGVCTGGTVSVAGAVNYNAGTVTVNGAVAARHGLLYERTNVVLVAGTNVITAVYHGPAFTNTAMVATSISAVVVGTTVYGHDANGNLTNDATFAYRYDVLNRLTNVVRKADGASVLANRYDGLGRRVEAVRNGTNVERYVYVPGTFLVLAVLDGNNDVKEFYAHGPDLSGTLAGAGGIGGILSQTAGTHTTFLHADISGNIAFASDASGNLVGTNRYTPYGNLISQMGAFNGRYMFSSKEWEPEAGLYYYGHRFYSPTLGRWLSRDPLGEFADPLHNLYRFVGNNPLNAVDPLGLYWLDDVSDFSAGWGDTLTTIPFTDLSLTREFRNLLPGIYGDNGGVNRSSLIYGAGEWGGIANSLILGAKGFGNLTSKIGNQSARTRLYEIGQRTLTRSEYSKYSDITDPVRRGIAMIRDGATGAPSLSGMLSQSWKTIGTGLTPEAASALGDIGAGLGGTAVGGTGLLNKSKGDCP